MVQSSATAGAGSNHEHPVTAIDLNVDLGETDALMPSAAEEALLAIVSSVNLSCGAHAGNRSLLRALLALATARGVTIGAHPSYDDRAHFGRRETGESAARIGELVARQLRELAALARETGARLRYVKPHGALYHRTATDAAAADALARAVHAHDPRLWLLGPAGSRLARAAGEHGLGFAAEGFLDRGYRADGTLVPRGQPGDLVHEPAAAADRALAFARGEPIAAADGTRLRVPARSLCTHGDSQSALPLLKLVRVRLLESGIRVQPFVP